MERVSVAEAVHTCFQRALEMVGGRGHMPDLLALIALELPEYDISQLDPKARERVLGTVNRWKEQNPPPARVLFALQRRLPGFSLDAAASATDQAPIED